MAIACTVAVRRRTEHHADSVGDRVRSVDGDRRADGRDPLRVLELVGEDRHEDEWQAVGHRAVRGARAAVAHHEVGDVEHRGLIDPLLEVHIARHRAQLAGSSRCPIVSRIRQGRSAMASSAARNTDGAIDM